MTKLKIGLIHQGNDTDDIWGCSVTTFFLKKALEKLGHIVWRYSVTYDCIKDVEIFSNTDFLIAEGTPKTEIPSIIWNNASFKVFWWLSDLYYNQKNILLSGFNGIATNSIEGFTFLNSLIPTAKIDLAADIELCAETRLNQDYNESFVYLGNYPHKSKSQMDKFFIPAQEYGFSLWGKGWDKSDYYISAKGILPFSHIGSLYRQSKASFILTEEKQRLRGMFNNRVYEVLGSGCLAISEPYSDLEKSDLGKFIFFCENEKEVKEMLKEIIKNYKNHLANNIGVREYIKSHHSYDVRAIEFISMYKKYYSSGGSHRSDLEGFSEKSVE